MLSEKSISLFVTVFLGLLTLLSFTWVSLAGKIIPGVAVSVALGGGTAPTWFDFFAFIGYLLFLGKWVFTGLFLVSLISTIFLMSKKA